MINTEENVLGTYVTKNIQNSNGGVIKIKKKKRKKNDYVRATVSLAEKQFFFFLGCGTERKAEGKGRNFLGHGRVSVPVAYL